VDLQLRITVPGLPDLRVRLSSAGPWVIGTSAECTIPVRARGVSRRHVELVAGEPGLLTFRDLGSTNGTLWNGERSAGGPAPPGSVLQLGQVMVKVEEAATEALGFDPALAEVEVGTLLGLHSPAAAMAQDISGEVSPFAGFSAVLERLVELGPAGDRWSALCAVFAEALGCTAVKCYSIHGEQLSSRANVGPFPDERVPPRLAQACSLLPVAASFRKLDPGQPPLALLSLPVRLGHDRAVVLGVVPPGSDPVLGSAETILALPVLFRLVLSWTEELEAQTQAVVALRDRLNALRNEPGRLGGGHEPILGQSAALLDALEAAERAGVTEITVLLHGETGTGKELVARRIHACSRRRRGPFVPVNCAAIPPALLESELFGAEKGAYTSLDRSSKGRFEAASGGTLFLDEVGDMPPSLQATILRALESKEVTPLGGGRPRPADVRLIAATNKDLPALVDSGDFRGDLYYRLAGMVVELPPLRERTGDVVLLARSFLELVNRELGTSLQGFEEEALTALAAYPWPGNVRELLACVRSLAIRSTTPVVTAEAVRRELGRARPGHPLSPPGLWELRWHEAREVFEREYFSRRLAAHHGSLAALARETGIARPNLYLKLKKLGIAGEA
jgi:transcriptional regulator with GAF, ATPase, and Fis domain